MKPWGLTQNLPCCRNKVRSRLYDRIEYNSLFTGPLSNDLSTDAKIAEIGKRQIALESSLKEYVVNVDIIGVGSSANSANGANIGEK